MVSIITVIAQTNSEKLIFEVIDGPSQLGIVKSLPIDLNNDGLTDVISASIDDGHIRAYINQGNLEFHQEIITVNVPGILGLSLIDFNLDGAIDLLVTSIETNEVILFTSDNGQFNKKVVAKGILLPTDAQAGDFNQDGLLDVISLSFETGEVLLHQQKITGNFVTSIIAENVIGPRKIEVVDMNNDQLLDFMVVSSTDNSLRLFTNTSNESGIISFSEKVINQGLDGPRYVTSCDVNGDVFPEVIVSDTLANKVLMLVNIDGIQFIPEEIATMIQGVSTLHCKDLDNDQQPEVVAVALFTGEIYWLEFDDSSEKKLLANSRDGYVTVNSGDFDGDGVFEILTQSFFEQRNLIYFPHFNNAETVVWEDFPEGASSVTSGDINADGVEDVVVSSFRNDRIQWYDGLSFERHVIAENIDGATEVVVADLDQDGDLDVISAASNANSFYWHKNSGNEQFVTLLIYGQALFANSLAVADVNDDGHLDVIGTSGTDDSVRWFNRTGDSFEVLLLDDGNDAPNDVEIADMDGDGDLDLVVANYFSNDVSWCLNQNNLVFECSIISQNKGKAHSISLLDYDDDGDQDMYLSASSDDQFWLLINQGNNGEFLELLAAENNNPRQISTHNSLLAVALPDENQVVLYLNHSLGGLPYLTIESLMGASSVYFQQQPGHTLLMTSLQNSQVAKLRLIDLIFTDKFEFK